jgi:hypothetical protein
MISNTPVISIYIYLEDLTNRLFFLFHDLLREREGEIGLRMGLDGTKKIIPWDKFFFNYPIRWDERFLKSVPSHRIATKKFSSHVMELSHLTRSPDSNNIVRRR